MARLHSAVVPALLSAARGGTRGTPRRLGFAGARATLPAPVDAVHALRTTRRSFGVWIDHLRPPLALPP